MAYDSLTNQKSFTLPNVKKVVRDVLSISFFEWFVLLILIIKIVLISLIKNNVVKLFFPLQVTQYCEADMLEARWFYSGYTPTLEEYLNNAWITTGIPAIYLTTYFFSSSEITPEVLENVVYLNSMIVRLSNDLQTSSVYISFRSLAA